MSRETIRGRAGKALGAGLLVAGLVLLVWYEIFELGLPRGLQEFAYWPPLEPLPFAAMRGFTYEQLGRHLGRLLLLGPALVLLAWGVWAYKDFRAPGGRTLGRLTLLLSGGSLVLSTLVMGRVLKGRAIVDDELTYRMQALLYAEGRLAEATVPPWGEEPFTIWTRLGATGKYLFGEPLVQMPGSLLGLPAFAHLALAALTLFLWHRIVAREAGAEVARWATVLLAASPMFVLTTATGMSHATSLACVVVAGRGYQMVRDGRPWAGVLAVGNALGFALTARPQVAVPVGLVIGGATVYRLLRRRQILPLALLGGVGLGWLLVIGLYNLALTDSLFTLPWYLARPRENYGFGLISDVSPYVHTPWRAVENLLVSTVRFNGWWLGWPLSLALLIAWALLRRPRQGASLWLWIGAAAVAFHVPYYSPGVSDTGPVYYYELLLPAALLGGHTLVAALRRWPGATVALLMTNLAFGTTTFLWENISRLHRLVAAIHSPMEEILEELEPPALLIVETASQESLQSGWVFSVPVRYRSDGDPIVIYPRGPVEYVPHLRQRYTGRRCAYYRINPQSLGRELLSCEEAEQLLMRSRVEGPPLWLRYPPTAVIRGLLDPFADG